MNPRQGCFRVLSIVFLTLFLCGVCSFAYVFYRQTNSSPSPTPRLASAPLIPTATPTEEETLRSIVLEITGADEILRLFHYTDIVTVRYPATAGLVETDRQFLEMICAMRSAGFTAHEFRFAAVISVYDAAGNPYNVEGLEMFIQPAVAARINCNELSRVDLPALAYVYDVDPAFH